MKFNTKISKFYLLILLFCLTFTLLSCSSPNGVESKSSDVLDTTQPTSSIEETEPTIEPTIEDVMKPLEYESTGKGPVAETSKPKPSYDKTFKDNYVQFNYPSTWAYSVDPKDDVTSYDFSDATSMRFWYTMGVSLLSNLKYDEDDYRTLLSESYSDVDFLELKNLTLDGYDAIKMKYLYSKDDEEYFMIRYDTIVGNKSLRFFCTSVIEHLGDYEDICDDMMQSVDILTAKIEISIDDDLDLYVKEDQGIYKNYEKKDGSFDCTVKVKKDEKYADLPHGIKFLILDHEDKLLNNVEVSIMEHYFDDYENYGSRNDVIRILGKTDEEGKIEWENPTIGRHNFLITIGDEDDYYFALEVDESVICARVNTIDKKNDTKDDKKDDTKDNAKDDKK